MAVVANVNGRLCSERDAKISVLDHGFLFGEGVYETLRTYHGRPFLLDRHMRRLRASAAMIDLAMPLTDEELAIRIRETCGAIEGATEIYLRILLTRGPGEFSYDPSASPDTSVVILARPFNPPAPELYARGVAVAVVSMVRSFPNALNPRIKCNNLLANALAMREALRRGAYEGLMLNHRGEITECTQSNFFVVKAGRAITPPLDCGLLAGITREVLIEWGLETGVPVDECPLRVADLADADEAFLTSTTRELLPVVRIDDHAIRDCHPGPVTRRLHERFRERVEILSRA